LNIARLSGPDFSAVTINTGVFGGAIVATVSTYKYSTTPTATPSLAARVFAFVVRKAM
jgi:hypothetical protein